MTELCSGSKAGSYTEEEGWAQRSTDTRAEERDLEVLDGEDRLLARDPLPSLPLPFGVERPADSLLERGPLMA